DRGRPSTYALENPNMRVPPTSKSRTILSTSNIKTFSIPISSSMPTHNIAPKLRSNPSCVGSLRIHPPTPQHASLKSIIESQAKILMLLPDTPEFYEVRQEVIKQIHALESTLLESTGLAAPEQVHHFRKEASDEDLKYALMHGSQGLRQHMIDRGEELVIEHEYEDVQQSNSLKGATESEDEDATEGCDDFVAGQNESIDLLETHLENNPEIQ
ncbi:hypothetical protein KI387_014248, partial [Taxus chinensis]